MSRHSLAAIAAITAVTLFFVMRVDKDQCFFGDNLAKYTQSKSLLKNNFQSEEYVYPARADLDPEFRYFPFDGIYLVKVKDRFLGQYPIAFTAFSAQVLRFFSNAALYYISVIAYLLLVLLFEYVERPHPLVLVGFALGTPLLVMSVDYSEQTAYALFNAAGIAGFLASYGKGRPGLLLLSGILIGLTSFLRLEHLLLCFSLGVFALLKNDGSFKDRFAGIFPFAAGATASFLLFIAFNTARYGLPLGPRMAANTALFWTGWQAKLLQITTMLFAGKLQIGFVPYLPALVVVLIILFRKRYAATLSSAEAVLHPALILFVFLISATSPGDGALNWGPRYLVLAFFPGFILLSRAQKTIETGKIARVIMIVLLLLPAALTFIGTGMRKTGCRQQKQYLMEFQKSEADIWVFSDTLLLHYEGPQYFEHETYLVRDAGAFTRALRTHRRGKTVAVFTPRFGQSWQKGLEDKVHTEGALDEAWRKNLLPIETKNSEFLQIQKFRVP